MSKQDEGRHQHKPTESPADQGEREPAGSTPEPTGQSTGDIYKETFGHEPVEGETLEEEVEKSDPHNIPPEPAGPEESDLSK